MHVDLCLPLGFAGGDAALRAERVERETVPAEQLPSRAFQHTHVGRARCVPDWWVTWRASRVLTGSSAVRVPAAALASGIAALIPKLIVDD